MGRKRSNANRFLPKHVYSFASQHGKERLVFRRKGWPTVYFKAAFGTKGFQAEYDQCIGLAPVAVVEVESRAKAGTLGELRARYFAVADRLGPTAVTQGKIRAVIEDFCKGRVHYPIALVDFEDIDRIVAAKKIKTGIGNKTRGGIHAARKLRKELIRMFDFGMKAGLCPSNPARQSERVKDPAGQRSKGFHSWTEQEIYQYRVKWGLGTRERLAMELLLWTDQRRSDVVKMGKAQIQGGRLPIEQAKTGETLWMPVAPQLLQAIVAMPPADTSPFCFLVTKRGKPFSKESFGNWFKQACVDAGLPHCTAHGLRKATLRRMAELEMANKSMKSVSGQRRDETLAGYIEGANQKKLADSAITTLARWELRFRAGEQNDDYRFTAND